MNAEIITIGTEILLGQIIDTNSAYLSQKLAELGINVFFKTSVGDNKERLINALQTAAKRADLLILTGGLGPTVDDITRQAVSEFAGQKLVLNQDVLNQIHGFFQQRNLPMSKNNEIQAYFPEKSKVLLNPNGTAPGFLIESPQIVACIPGVPREMKGMFENQLAPYLVERLGLENSVIYSKVLKILGLSESMADEKIKDLFETSKNPSIGILAMSDEIHLRLTAKARTAKEAHVLINSLKEKIYALIGKNIYGEDEETLEQKIAQLLFAKKLTISTAESCTSGLLAYRLTEIAGSSAYYIGGVNSYSNDVKINLMGVSSKTIEQYGAVSEETAKEMVYNCKEKFNTDISIAITGIAGPGGGSIEKPVGLVYIGLNIKGKLSVFHIILPGNREMIRKRTVNLALFHLLNELKKDDE